MLYTFLLTLLIIDCFVVMLAILLQSGKGSGLAASFGGASCSIMRTPHSGGLSAPQIQT